MLVACVLAIVCAHAMAIRYQKIANVDEAYAASIGERLLEGFKLYDGAVSQRGPLMYYAFELLAKVFGWDNVLAIRLAALASSLAHLGLVYGAARALLSRRAAVIAAAMVAYALAFGMRSEEGLALHGETLLVPPLFAGAVLGACAMRAPAGSAARAVRLALAGVLLSAAACVKQTVLVHPLPLAVWLVAERVRGDGARAGLARDLGTLAASFALLPAALLAHAAREGTLRSLLYYCVTYNLTVHTRPMNEFAGWFGPVLEQSAQQPLFFVAVGTALAMLARAAWRRGAALYRTRWRGELTRGFGVRGYMALHFALAFAVAASVPQLFRHYYLVPLPFLAFVVAAHVDDAARGARAAALLRAALVGCAAIWGFASFQLAYVRRKVEGRVSHDAVVEDVARYVASTTAPSDRVFVWGFSPWLYTYSHRRPAGRFVFITYPIGFVPWFWHAWDLEADRVVPETMDQLLSDLEREDPKVIVDAGSVLIARPMRAYERPSAFLHARYCFDVRIGAYDVYRRRAAGGCADDAFPRQAPPVDYEGHPMTVPLPTTVDAPTSRPLPPGKTEGATPRRFDPSRRACFDPARRRRSPAPPRLACAPARDDAGDDGASTEPTSGDDPDLTCRPEPP